MLLNYLAVKGNTITCPEWHENKDKPLPFNKKKREEFGDMTLIIRRFE